VYGLTSHPTSSDTGVRIGGGATREFRFRADVPGTYYYWASTTGGSIDRQWFESQLTGALIVDPPNAPADDRVFVIGAWFRPGDSSLAVPRAPRT
jgi:FtsP/CotA-like multicopper oxidase with cupredoxin domain